MFKSKLIVALLIMCSVYRYQCTPLSSDTHRGRGIGSTLWDWVTYPISWWNSGSTEIPPETDIFTGPAPQDIEVATHNVTVWCNDQTCTTMRCDKHGCANVTCNIYDTYLNGECRHYNTVRPEVTSVTAEVTVKPDVHVTEASSQLPPVAEASSQPPATESAVDREERPLELEAVLSSTVAKDVYDKQ